MTDPEASDRYHPSLDLLRSLQASILRLRHQAEHLRQQLERHGVEAVEEAEHRQVAKLDSLIRDCQKVEKTLALCEGEITSVSRVWADGEEVSPLDLNMTD